MDRRARILGCGPPFPPPSLTKALCQTPPLSGRKLLEEEMELLMDEKNQEVDDLQRALEEKKVCRQEVHPGAQRGFGAYCRGRASK